MSNNSTQSFGFIPLGSGGGTPPTTPNWQAVTNAGNTTNKDIFVKDGSGNDYLRVDKTNNRYFLGNGASLRGISADSAGQTYVFGEDTGVKIVLSGGGTPSMAFTGTTLYQFSDGIAPYASGLYQAVVLNTTPTPDELQIQPKDMVPVVTKLGIAYTATADDCVILARPASAITNTTITLPTAGILPGKRFYVKKVGGSVNVILDPTGAATIDGAATKTISTLYECIQVTFDGANYWII